MMKQQYPDNEIEIRFIGKGKKYTKEGITIVPCTIVKRGWFRSDVIHYFGQPSPFVYLLLRIASYKKCYMTMMDGDVWRFRESHRSKLSLPLIKKNIAKIYLYTRHQYNLLQQHVDQHIIDYSFPLIPEYKPKKKKSPHPRILFMSHFSKHKWIYELLNAYTKLLKSISDIELVVANSGINKSTKENEKIKTLIKEINNSGWNITLKWKVDPEAELSQAWIYIYCFTQSHNTFAIPISLYESLACGTAFVSTDVWGVWEYINTDYLLKNISADLLLQKIQTTITHIQNKTLNVSSLSHHVVDNKAVIESYYHEYQKDTIGFVYGNSHPHYAHRNFISLLETSRINSMVRKKPFRSIPALSFWSYIRQRRKIRKPKYILLVWWIWLTLNYLIKIFHPQKKTIFLNADPFFYDLSRKNKIVRNLLLLFLAKVDGIIANSLLNKKTAQQYFSWPIKVVHPHLRTIEVRWYHWGNDTKELVYIGRQSHEKNVTIMIDYARYYKVKLHIYGWFTDSFQTKYWNDYVLFHGKKEIEVITKEIRQRNNTVYWLLVSSYDSFGITPLEFVLMGVIPIISANVWSKEILGSEDIVIDDQITVDNLHKKITFLDSIDKAALHKYLLDNIQNTYPEEEKQAQLFYKSFYAIIKSLNEE